jgi:hypothetical protein
LHALLGPRFGVEATFIVVVAILAGLLELPLAGVVGSVFGAWVLIALVEVALSRQARARPEPKSEPEPEPEPEPEQNGDLMAEEH